MLRSGITAFIAALTVFVSAAFAQGVDRPNPEPMVIEQVDPPRAETAETYQGVARQAGAQTDVAYATKVDWEASPTTTPVPERRRDSQPVDLNGFGVLLTVMVLLGALFLWLKFGGSGVLLSREPTEAKPTVTAPASWNIGADEMAGSVTGLLDRIASMSDRSAALVLLLRHCLLSASRATDTRFARSDTERLAFRRLPPEWSLMTELETLLHSTELAHYGARPVAEDTFAKALHIGRAILDARPGKDGRHG